MEFVAAATYGKLLTCRDFGAAATTCTGVSVTAGRTRIFILPFLAGRSFPRCFRNSPRCCFFLCGAKNSKGDDCVSDQRRYPIPIAYIEEYCMLYVASIPRQTGQSSPLLLHNIIIIYVVRQPTRYHLSTINTTCNGVVVVAAVVYTVTVRHEEQKIPDGHPKRKVAEPIHMMMSEWNINNILAVTE